MKNLYKAIIVLILHAAGISAQGIDSTAEKIDLITEYDNSLEVATNTLYSSAVTTGYSNTISSKV